MTRKDGKFFIPFEDYCEQYCVTSFAAEQDDIKYHHSLVEHDFNKHSPLQSQAFFSFELLHEIRFDRFVFAITVVQQGNRLQNYFKRRSTETFKPSNFNIVLMTARGKFIRAIYCRNSFAQSLINN